MVVVMGKECVTARSVAGALVRRFGIEAPPHVTIERFAVRLKFKLQLAPIGATAHLLAPPGRKPRILLSTRVTEPARRRFAIAHEMGHHLLDHPSLSIAQIGDPMRHRRDPAHEAEANAFALELLMPDVLVRPHWDDVAPSLDHAFRMAYMFGVTAPIAALRLLELTPAMCAVVLSKRGKVRWAVSNDALAEADQLHDELDPRSRAYRYFAHGVLSPNMDEVPAGAWLRGREAGTIMEHSVASHEHEAVLTLLWQQGRCLLPPRGVHLPESTAPVRCPRKISATAEQTADH